MRVTHGRDAGYTLIELLVTVAVVGVITVPLAGSVLGYLRNSDVAAERMALSHDAQIGAAYFARDVASMGVRDYSGGVDSTGTVPFEPSVETAAAYDTGGVVCGTAATPAAVVRFLSDNWDTSRVTAVVKTDVVAYYLRSTGTTAQLRRIKCGSASPVTDTAVAHNVDPATVSVTCSTACSGTPVPERVTLSYTVRGTVVPPYTVTLVGQRRQT